LPEKHFTMMTMLLRIVRLVVVALLLAVHLSSHVLGYVSDRAQNRNSIKVKRGASRLYEVAAAVPRKVLIVGGGFGGLYTALKIEQLSKGETQVVLVDPKDKFVFLPLLYELAVGTASVLEVAPRYSELLKSSKGITFMQGSVEDIDLKSRQVRVVKTKTKTSNEVKEEEPVLVQYDKLVVACGAQPNLNIIPGVKEHCLPFCRVEDAYDLKRRLGVLMSSTRSAIRVVVIGGGYSGVEVATTLAEYIGKSRAVISLVDRNDCIMHTSPEHNRKSAEKVLVSRGVAVNCNTSVKKVTATGLMLENQGEEFNMPADLVIATLGMQQCELLKALDLDKDKSGRLVTRRSLQCPGDANVFALGDCASIQNVPLPSTAQVAMQQAEIVARNVQLLLQKPSTTTTTTSSPSSSTTTTSAALEKFQYVPLGEMLTLGTTDASVTSLGGLVELDGPLAALGRRLVYAIRMPTPEQRVTALLAQGIQTAGNVLSSLRNRGDAK